MGDELQVHVNTRDNELKITGEAENVMLAVRTINGLLSLNSRGEVPSLQTVRYVIGLVREGRRKSDGWCPRRAVRHSPRQTHRRRPSVKEVCGRF